MHTLTFTDSAGKPGTLTHPGPLEAAQKYFHGAVGPQWPCALDGRQGHFTSIGDVVRFVEPRPGGLPGDIGAEEHAAQPVRR